MKYDELTKDIQALLAIPSTDDNLSGLHQAVDFVTDFVARRAKGVTIERFERNGKPSFLAHRGAARPERFDVILNGHVDVVAGDEAQFVPRVSGGKLYGRGAFDMKAAALTEAMVFCEMLNKTPYTLGLQIVSDEEIGGFDGAMYQIEQGVRADFVITGEHTLSPDVIYTEQRGICWIEVAFSGKTAHGGYPWNGENALTRASRFAHAVLERYPVPEQQIWGTTANIAAIHTSNTTHNRVPEDARVKIDFRFTPEDAVFHAKKNVEAFVHSIDPDARLVAMPVYDPAMAVKTTNPYLHRLVASLEHISRRPVRFDRRYAGGDARHCAAVGDDAVEFGLTGAHMHGAEEYVDLVAIEPYAATLRAFLDKDIIPDIRATLNQTTRSGSVRPASRTADGDRELLIQ